MYSYGYRLFTSLHSFFCHQKRQSTQCTTLQIDLITSIFFIIIKLLCISTYLSFHFISFHGFFLIFQSEKSPFQKKKHQTFLSVFLRFLQRGFVYLSFIGWCIKHFIPKNMVKIQRKKYRKSCCQMYFKKNIKNTLGRNLWFEYVHKIKQKL